MTRDELQDDWPDAELLFLDPPALDAAIIGVCERFGQEPIVAYDRERVVAILAEDMGEEDAEEWFEFNTIGAWVGEATPCFITLDPDSEDPVTGAAKDALAALTAPQDYAAFTPAEPPTPEPEPVSVSDTPRERIIAAGQGWCEATHAHDNSRAALAAANEALTVLVEIATAKITPALATGMADVLILYADALRDLRAQLQETLPPGDPAP